MMSYDLISAMWLCRDIATTVLLRPRCMFIKPMCLNEDVHSTFPGVLPKGILKELHYPQMQFHLFVNSLNRAFTRIVSSRVRERLPRAIKHKTTLFNRTFKL